MCRSIKVLRKPGPPATPDELQAAARQFIRKISGFPKPSRANQEAFERAIAEVAESSRRLLESVGPARPPKESPPILQDAPAGGGRQPVSEETTP